MAGKLLSWIFRNRKLLELILFAFVVVTYLAWRSGMAGMTIAARLAIALLAVFYYASARFPSDLGGTYGIIAAKVVGLSSMISLVGMLLVTMGTPLGARISFLGAFSLLLAIILLLISWMRSRSSNYVTHLVRAVVWCGSAGWVYWDTLHA